MQHVLAFTSFALLAACGGPATRGLRLGDPPRAPVPADIDHAELTLDGTGGIALYVQRWRPRTGTVRGVVVVHHGLADHSARYAGFAERLVRAGYSVWAHDMRGHARSAGPRVSIGRIDELTGDLDKLVALVRAQEHGLPLFLFGHSLGGLTTVLYAIEHQPNVAGVILSAPGIAFDIPAFGAGAIRFASAIAPNAPLLKTPHEEFSTSSEVIAEMGRDPLIESQEGPARTARSATDGVRRIWAHPERLVVPVLAVHGTNDKVVAPIASRDLVARAGTPDRTLRLYDDLQHDLLHEPDGGADRVAQDIVAWLDAHTGGPAVSFAPPQQQKLRGDRGSMSLAVELDARGERTRSDATGASAGVRIRIGVGRVGYVGGLDLRAGYLDGGSFDGELHPLGFGVRGAAGHSIAVTGGVGLARGGGATSTQAPIEAALELPLGPVHVLARAAVAWRLSGPDLVDDGLSLGDEARALVGLRLGRDHQYWPGTVAGAGPFAAFSYRNIGGDAIVGIAIGGQIWGGNLALD
jgi:acylglycerol lipase